MVKHCYSMPFEVTAVISFHVVPMLLFRSSSWPLNVVTPKSSPRRRISGHKVLSQSESIDERMPSSTCQGNFYMKFDLPQQLGYKGLPTFNYEFHYYKWKDTLFYNFWSIYGKEIKMNENLYLPLWLNQWFHRHQEFQGLHLNSFHMKRSSFLVMMDITGCLKKTQHFLSWISQRWFDQINCPFCMLFSIAIQFYKAQF